MPMLSINLSYDISGAKIKCHNDFINDFSVIFNVFIKIHENMHKCKLISKVETYV